MRIRASSPISGFTLALYLAAAIAQSAPKPIVSAEPLNAEQILIYRTFLAGYLAGTKVILNVAQTTSPFETNEDDLSGCMKMFSKSNSRSSVVHTFSKDALPTDVVHLVDPETHAISDPGTAIRQGQPVDSAVNGGFKAALFTFSEIVFDASHTHAAFSYSFHCGSLCGHGGTVVFALDHGKWKRAKATCGYWIS